MFHSLSEFEKPLFKQGVSSLSDLKPGELLTGRVTNTTHFGAFVDAGVGRDGLVHSSRITPALLNGKKTLELGDRVEVIVENVDVQRGRLGLKLHRLCWCIVGLYDYTLYTIYSHYVGYIRYVFF